MCCYDIVERVVLRPLHAFADVVRDVLAGVPAGGLGGVPAGTYADVGGAAHRAGLSGTSRCIDQHLGAVGEDDECALPGGCVDEMNVEHALRPGGQGLADGLGRLYRIRDVGPDVRIVVAGCGHTDGRCQHAGADGGHALIHLLKECGVRAEFGLHLVFLVVVVENVDVVLLALGQHADNHVATGGGEA